MTEFLPPGPDIHVDTVGILGMLVGTLVRSSLSISING